MVLRIVVGKRAGREEAGSPEAETRLRPDSSLPSYPTTGSEVVRAGPRVADLRPNELEVSIGKRR